MATLTRLAVVGAVLMASSHPATYGQETVEAALGRIYSQYVMARTGRDIGRLVSLDGDLRQMMASNQSIEASHLRPGYEDLGLSGAAFDPGSLVYSGKILRDAHKINPRSPSRNFTLYATVFPKGEDVGDIPNVEAARAYLREFPEGPFAADVYLDLAHFRDDLYKVFQGFVEGGVPEYKLDCYNRYVTKQPYREQLKAAQNSGVANYRRALALRPGDTVARESLTELLKGTTLSWYFCPD